VQVDVGSRWEEVNKGRSGGRWQCEATHGVTAESTGKKEWDEAGVVQ
jgi:hypothetical protein